MDLGAYIQKDFLSKLLPSIPPRLRGIRLMKIQEKANQEGSETFDSFVGEDVIYIHTRCGQCGWDLQDSNYGGFGMNIWEEELGDLVLASEDEAFDCTYRDTYIKVPLDKKDLYEQILEEYFIEKNEENL